MFMMTFSLFPNWELTAAGYFFNTDADRKTADGTQGSLYAKYMFYENAAKTGGFAVKGGTGFTKCSGNYAASLLSQANAYKSGFVQVLWLDGIHRKYIEEVGAMNVCFVIDGKLVTPMLNGSILPGITRKSVLETAVTFGLEVEERLLSIEELGALHAEGRVSEMFGCGTAAVISPVGSLKYQDTVMNFNNGQIGPVSQRMYDTLTGIQYGRLPDPQGWIEKV